MTDYSKIMGSSGEAQDKMLGPLIRAHFTNRHNQMLKEQGWSQEDWSRHSEEIVDRAFAENQEEIERPLADCDQVFEDYKAGRLDHLIETPEESRQRELEIWQHHLEEYKVTTKEGLRAHIKAMIPDYLATISMGEFEAVLDDITINVLLRGEGFGFS